MQSPTHTDHHNHSGRGKQSHQQHEGHDKHAGHSPEMFKRRFFICLLLTLPVLYFAPMFQHWFNYQAIEFPGVNWVTPMLSTVIYFYGGWVFLHGAWYELRSKIGMMTLVALDITVSYVYSVAVSLGLSGDSFYMELATLVDIMLLGHWIEMISVQGASRALEHLADLVPAVAHKQVNGRIEDVPVSALVEGDRILIRPGEQVPIDGVAIEGTSNVNEAFLTGESRPVVKKTNDEVIAGAVNGEGALIVKVTRTGDRTTLSQIMRLVEEAQASKSQYQTLADRLAYWLTLMAIGAGTNVAIESADLVLVKSDPLDAAYALKLAKATYSKMTQNLFWATGYNAIGIPLAAGIAAPFGILLSPAVGAILMSVSTVVVSINAMLLRRTRLSD